MVFRFHLTSRFNEVQFPRKFRPREDFSSNRSSELKNPNRAGEIYRAEIEFGKPKCNEVSVKSLLADPSVARVQRGRAFFSAEKKRRSFLTAENRIISLFFIYF